MNDKSDDMAQEKVLEETAEDVTAGAEEVALSSTDEQPDTSEPVDQGKRIAGGGAWFAFLLLFVLLVAAAVAAGYYILDINKDREVKQAEIVLLQDKLEALQQDHASLKENARRRDNRLARIDEQLGGILRNLNRPQSQSNNAVDWQLAEIRYLLRIAAQRLALAGDTETVQAILRSADAGLREIPDPALIPVREQLIADVNRLEAFAGTDITGLVLALGDLAERVEQLPLNLSASAAEDPVPADDPVAPEGRWRQLAHALWQELKSLLVISRTDRSSVALLAPRERFFLQQNLRLQLEAARLAVLIRDGDQLRESTSAGVDWLNEFFDTGDDRVRNALEILDAAASADLERPVASIDATLKAFDAYLAQQGNPATAGEAR